MLFRSVSQSRYDVLWERNLLQSIIDSGPVIVILWKQDGSIIKFNKYAQEITGFSEKEVCGINWLNIIIPKELKPFMKEVFEEIKRGNLPQDMENPILCKDGREIHILWRNRFINDSKGEKIFISMGINITERKKIENDLQNNFEELSAVYEELAASEEELRQQFDELRQNQEALRKSEERYKIAVDGANDWLS